MNQSLSRSAVGALIAFGTVSAFGQNLLTNPGFETGDTSGWTLNDPDQASGVVSLAAHSGNYGFFASPAAGFSPVELSQGVVTGAGNYTVSFWVLGFSNAFTGTDQFQASWNGQVIQTGVPSDQQWHQYSFVEAGGSGSTTLDFLVNPDREGGIQLDDVNVSAVPEPATLAGLGFGALVLLRKRGR